MPVPENSKLNAARATSYHRLFVAVISLPFLAGCAWPSDTEFRSRVWERFSSGGYEALIAHDREGAEVMFRSAVEQSRYFGTDPRLAASLSTLADLLTQTGRTVEAEADYKEALAIFAKTADADKSTFLLDQGKALTGLGDVLLSRGDFKTAKSSYENALNLLGEDTNAAGQNYDPIGTTITRAMCGLAKAYAGEGDYKTSLDLYHQAAQTAKKTIGQIILRKRIQDDFDHFLFASGLSRNAAQANPQPAWEALIRQGHNAFGEDRLDDAQAKFEQALVLAKDINAENARVPETVWQLAGVYAAQGHLDKAEKLCVDTLNTLKTPLPYNFQEDELLLVLGKIYDQERRVHEKVLLLEKQLEIRRHIPAETEARRAETAGQLAAAYAEDGDRNKARQMAGLAQTSIAAAGEGAKARISNACLGLARYYEVEGDFSSAHSWLERALKIRRSTKHAATSTRYAAALVALGNLFTREKNYAEAEKNFEEALLMLYIKIDQNNLAYARAALAYADCLYLDNKLPAAEKVYEEAWQTRQSSDEKQIRGMDSSFNNYVAILSKQGRTAESSKVRDLL